MVDWVAGAVLEAILNGVVQGLALAALVWALLRVFPRTNAATRYAVWSVTLVLVAGLPFAGLVGQYRAPAGQATGLAHRGLAALTLPSGQWPAWLLGFWLLAAVGMLARVAFSYRSIQRLKRLASPLPPEHQERFERVLRSHAGRRSARLCGSAEIVVPMAAGLRSPVILVPESLPGQLSEEEFEQVLVHELAHIQRRDDWTNLAQKLIEAVWFFHPAVRWIGRRLNLEREIACDDWVVSVTGGARPYAACLTKLAGLSMFAPKPQLAHGVAGTKPQITRRVEALLDRQRSLSPAFSRLGLVAGAGALALAVSVAGRIAPVTVAERPLPSLAGPGAAAPAVRLAYAVPRPPVAEARRFFARPASRPAVLPVVTERLRPGVRYVLIQEWTLAAPRDAAAAFCVFYIRGAGQVVTFFWTQPAPVRSPMNKA